MNIVSLKEDFLRKIQIVQDKISLESLRNEFIWKEGSLKSILANIKNLSAEEKKIIWVEANNLRILIEDSIKEKISDLERKEYEAIWEKEDIDIGLEYPLENNGHMHPISIASRMLEEIFISLGFKIETGPQIENELYNFDKLNIPDNHPARDVWDTFWLDDSINKNLKSGERLLLRTHTSPVQIRTMLKWELPIKIIAPGRVYRYEQEDARHTCNFYQLEWLVVGEKVSFWDLKGTLDTAMKKLLWNSTKTRFRPSIFPFTEPSAEVDVSCQICQWTGCRMCSGTGWVELLWSGMVHPRVLEMCWIDPEKYSWFAFGMWIDRIAAQRFWVSSSRMFYQNKLKLNEQF